MVHSQLLQVWQRLGWAVLRFIVGNVCVHALLRPYGLVHVQQRYVADHMRHDVGWDREHADPVTSVQGTYSLDTAARTRLTTLPTSVCRPELWLAASWHDHLHLVRGIRQAVVPVAPSKQQG